MSTNEPTNGRTASEQRSRWSRRRVLGTSATLVGGGLAGCTGSGNSKLEDQLETVRDATEPYTDPRAALRDGFRAGGPYVPGMGWHFQHPERGKEAVENGFDIEKPNLLTYVQGEDGLQLGAVEWGGPVGAVPENPDLFADDGSETWHVHEAATHVFALPDDERTNPANVAFDEWVTNDHWAEFRPPDPDLSAGDTVSLNWGSLQAKQGERTERVVDVAATHPDLNTLHAWIHTENPEGVFHPANPEYGNGHDHE